MKTENPQKKYRLVRNYENFGKFLHAGRVEAGLTQREVSEFLKYCSAQYISNFERGISVPPLKKLKIMTILYRIDVDKLMTILLDEEEKVLRRGLSGPKKATKAPYK